MNARTNRRRTQSQRGVAAVEAGIILPIVFFALLALIDFGRYLWINDMVNEAASEGLRMAVLVEPTESEVIEAALSEFALTGLDMHPVVEVGERTSGQPVTVSVSVGFSFLFLPDIQDPADWTLTALAEGISER